MTRAAVMGLLIIMMAHAGAQPTGARAEVLYNEGRELMRAGKLSEACVAFEQSQKLDPEVTTLIALATCREKLGQIATAWGLFLDVERQTRPAGDAMSKQINAVARARAVKLEPLVPRLTISVSDASNLDGLEIFLDQEDVPAVMWNRAIPVDGGLHTVAARAPGTSDWSTQVTIDLVSDAEVIDVPDLRDLKPALVARAHEPAVAVDPPRPPSAAKPMERHSVASRRSIAWPIAIGSTAVVLLGGTIGVSLWARSTYDEAKAELTVQTRRDSLYDSANRKRHVALGLAATGVGCTGVAIWLYLRQRSEKLKAISARVGHLRPTPVARGIGFAGWF